MLNALVQRAGRFANRFLRNNGYEIRKLHSADLYDYISIYDETYPSDSRIDKRFYNLGSGNWRHPYWTNLDKHTEYYSKSIIDIEFDLFDHIRLPIRDGTAEVFYTCHLIEHIRDEDVEYMFSEVFRALKGAGFFRIVTPDVDLAYTAYKGEDKHYFYEDENRRDPNGRKLSVGQMFLFLIASQLSYYAEGDAGKISDDELAQIFSSVPYERALDEICGRCSVEIQHKKPGFHMNWWNYDKLESTLLRAGFREVERSGYGQSKCAVMRDLRYFDRTQPKISLFVDAIKS